MLVFDIEYDINNPPLRSIVYFAETQAVTDYVSKEYIITLLLQDENVLSKICEEGTSPGKSLKSAALNDINQLLNTSIIPLTDYKPSIKRNLFFNEYQQSLEKIVSSVTCEEVLDKLIAHYLKFGGGKLSKYIAFKWDGELKGIEKPDSITLDQLYCLDSQKQILIENTVSFIKGLPSNNVLLYGSSGCGKSSAVKALLNRFYQDGLRIVQFPKESISELPYLLNFIKNKKFYYIVFLDDLSFENSDFRYKDLKTILEGSIEKQPQNVLFYATSNRLHIINELWSERQGDDVHITDTKNEKLSLSERFGIRLSFVSPNQNDYLKIIEGILSRPLTDDLRAEAIKWAAHHNGRSGRTAAQFTASFFSKPMYFSANT